MFSEEQGVFSKGITIEKKDLTRDGHWLPAAVLQRFQEVASDHVDSHGVGCHDLIRQHLLWVVLRTKFEICGEIQCGRKAVLKTWFNPPRHNICQREYLITTDSDDILVKGSALWIVMHDETRQIDGRLEEILLGQESRPVKNFSRRLALIKDFEPEDAGTVITASKTDIDFNGHVNNACYLTYMCAAAEGTITTCRTVQIDYHKELRIGESLRLFSKKETGGIKVKGISRDGQLIFIGMMQDEEG